MTFPLVALRKESVDRNRLYCRCYPCNTWSLSARRAWIEIICTALRKYPVILSLSARRAWIEILYQLYDTYAKVSLSARRAWIEIGSLLVAPVLAVGGSLSARRAWIEIIMFVNLRVVDGVALRKESVDRNLNAVQIEIVKM